MELHKKYIAASVRLITSHQSGKLRTSLPYVYFQAGRPRARQSCLRFCLLKWRRAIIIRVVRLDIRSGRGHRIWVETTRAATHGLEHL